MEPWLQRVWYSRSPWAWVLWPLSLLFIALAFLRRATFRVGLTKQIRVTRPVIVVGNISVGGTGKTPLVIWLAQRLKQMGHVPGVITRGYGGSSTSWPVEVTGSSDPAHVGDEAVLIAQKSGAVVVAGPDRVADANRAIALGATVIISDDGLQHYRLARDFEIAVVDGARGVGNGLRLPAGPLRESVARLDTVNAVAVTLRSDLDGQGDFSRYRPFVVRSSIREAHSMRTAERLQLSAFAARPVHAIAGVGNPDAFFAALRSHGLDVDGRALPDHAALSKGDLSFLDNAPVFMTEKDAVKCRALVDDRFWVVPQQVDVEAGDRLLSDINAAIRKT